MNKLTNINIKIKPQEVIQSLGRGKRNFSWMLHEIEAAVEMAEDLWQPVIIFDWVRVIGVNDETLSVVTGQSGQESELHLGPHAHLMSKAEIALVSVNSIGAGLEEKVKELSQNGEELAAYFLDSVGVVGLSKVANVASAKIEQKAAQRGWGVGARLSPGSLNGWSMVGQKDLCSLLPLEQGGVKLNQSGLIIPFKSASGLIGMGPEYKSSKVGSACTLCDHKETCWRRLPEIPVSLM